MIKHLVAPLIFTSLILTGCQSPQGKFTPEQVAAMQSYGFTESAGDWSQGLSDAILFAKNDYKLLPESQQQIQTMAAKLASTGLTHARMDGHTDNYGEDSYNEGLSLKRANVVADAWAMGGQIPRSNLTTQGLGKKYPIASNKTAQGRAEKPPRRSGDYYPLKHQQTDKKGPANWPALLNRMSLKRNLS